MSSSVVNQNMLTMSLPNGTDDCLLNIRNRWNKSLRWCPFIDNYRRMWNACTRTTKNKVTPLVSVSKLIARCKCALLHWISWMWHLSSGSHQNNLICMQEMAVLHIYLQDKKVGQEKEEEAMGKNPWPCRHLESKCSSDGESSSEKLKWLFRQSLGLI